MLLLGRQVPADLVQKVSKFFQGIDIEEAVGVRSFLEHVLNNIELRLLPRLDKVTL